MYSLRMHSLQQTVHPPQVIILLSCTLAIAATSLDVAAQWKEMDRSAPFASETAAAAMYQTRQWPAAVRGYGRVLEKNPKDAFAWYFMSDALLRNGNPERAAAAAEKATSFPSVRAHAFYKLACIRAQAGDKDGAFDALTSAREAQYVAPEGFIKKDPGLSNVRGKPRFAKLIASFDDVQSRFAALADADRAEDLIALWHANVHTWYRKTLSSAGVLQTCLEARMKFVKRGDSRGAERLALRARRGAKAADTMIGQGRHVEYVEAILDLDKKQIKDYESVQRKIKGLSTAIRSHSFGRVIRLAAEVRAGAEKCGDLLGLLDGHYAAGLAHVATVDHKQTRKGVSQADELALAREHWSAVGELARQLGDFRNKYQATDYLATLENITAEKPAREIIQMIWQGMILSSRFDPKEFELGMWEKMWVTALENGRKSAASRKAKVGK